jgi:succinyl-diaminopimelate desuccinylase
MNTAAQSEALYERLQAWIEAHFDEQVRFLQSLVQVPTDTPPGNNTPHALHTAALIEGDFGWPVQRHEVASADVQAHGLQSITNLVVQRRYDQGGAAGPGRIIALNAHGDVVPPGEGWSVGPYSGEVRNGKLYGRAAAVSKSDFASFVFAVRALESSGAALNGGVDLLFTYDEEFGGGLGPQWLLERGLTQPDLAIAAGFSYQVVTAHNGCLQLQVTVHGKMGHAAVWHTAVDALQAANRILNALYAENTRLQQHLSAVPGIRHGYINVGMISGGTNTNVVPGKVVLKLDRRMIPEEDPAEVEAALRALIHQAVAEQDGVRIEIERLVLARALKPLAGNAPLVQALTRHASAVFGEPIGASGTPLYTDARLFCERGIPAVIYGAGPRTVLESNAKRADEHVELADLKRATLVLARALADLLAP